MTKTKDIIFLLNMIDFLAEDIDDSVKFLTDISERRELTDIEKGRLQAFKYVKKQMELAYKK